MSRPNLLFIMTDQQRYDALGANGTPGMLTPHLDALAASGANLQNYFVNAPVCVPSRSTLFTGRYPHVTRNRENTCLLDPGREIHLFRVLHQAGYRLAYTGKNHVLESVETGNFEMFEERKTPATEALIRRFREANLEHGRSRVWKAGIVHDEPATATRAWQTAQPAVEFLERTDLGEAPFAAFVSFSDPHVPHLARHELFDRYDVDAIPVPEFEEAELDDRARTWLQKYHAFDAASATAADKRRYIAIYRAMVTGVDEEVGRILAALDRSGLRENTLIVFTTDHGDFNFEHGLAKKHLVLCDSLLHVPCIFAWPGRIRASRPDAMVEAVDLMPTILELLGLEIPPSVQGHSFAPLLRGETDAHRTAVYAEACPPYFRNRFPDFEAFAAENGGRGNTPYNVPGDANKSIRETGFRYVWYATGEEEMFDLSRDPAERWNVASDPAYADEKARLKLRLFEWFVRSEDPLDPMLVRYLQDRYNRWTMVPGQVKKWGHLDYPIASDHMPTWTRVGRF